MLGPFALLSLVGTLLACGSNPRNREYSVTLSGIQNIRKEWTVNPSNSRDQLVASLKDNARQAVRAATGFRQGDQEMRALTWNFDSVKFLQCQNILEMQDTTLTTTITELIGVTYYCLQTDGVIKGICTGKNCNSKEMSQVPVEYGSWNFRAALDLSNIRVALKWRDQMPIEQLKERVQAQIHGDMFKGAVLDLN